MSATNRVFGLDLLRAFAVLFVVYAHGSFLLRDSWVLDVVSAKTYRLGVFDGVTIFFVLSGFLIGRILLKTFASKNFDGELLVEFWIRRWFRTLPNYFLVLSFLIFSAVMMKGRAPPDIFNFYTFTQNFVTPHPAFFGEAWSLSVEEWFYLLIPIPMYLATKVKNLDQQKLILSWIIAVIVACTLFRIFRVYSLDIEGFSAWDRNLRKQVLTRMDSIMYGVLGAYLSINHQKLWEKIAWPGVFLGLFLIIGDKQWGSGPNAEFYRNFLRLSVFPIGTFLLLPKLSTWKRHSGLLVKVVTFVSLTSYSMYLVHRSAVRDIILPYILNTVMPWVPSLEYYRPVIAYASYWLITIILSYLLYRFFEKPMTSLRDKWPSRKRGESKVEVQL